MTDQRDDETNDDAPVTQRGSELPPVSRDPPPAPDPRDIRADARSITPAPPPPAAPSTALYAVIGILFTGTMLTLGFVAGRSSISAETTTATHAAKTADQRAAMARRNEVWRVLNDDGNVAADSPAKAAGIIVGTMLNADPDSREYSMRLFARKSVFAFSEGELEQLERIMIQGAPDEVEGAFAGIVAADKKSDELLISVFADKERIGRFLRHTLPIPLEKMPDGSTP